MRIYVLLASITVLLMSAAVLGALATVSSAASASTSAPVKKQRIAIEGVFSTSAGTGAFKLVPLTPGPLKPDSGTFVGTGDIKPAIIRNGQTVTVITGSDVHTGKRGSFTVTQRIEVVTAGGPLAGGARYRVATGTWSLFGGVGEYKGLAGKGAYASVEFPRHGNNLRFSEEGTVRAG